MPRVCCVLTNLSFRTRIFLAGSGGNSSTSTSRSCNSQRLDFDESNYNDTPTERAVCEAMKKEGPRDAHVVTVGFISSPAQRAGSYVAAGEVLWAVRGTINRQLTTIADFNSLPPAAIALVTEGSIRNAMTAIEKVIAWSRGDLAKQRCEALLSQAAAPNIA